MAEIVNLRRHRKRAARAQHATEAAEQRAHFGRSKNERVATMRDAERRERLLDGHTRERDPDEGEA